MSLGFKSDTGPVLLCVQERSSTTEVQLAETASELQKLKIRQRELEARNALLEQLANLNKQQKLQQGLQPGLRDLGGNEGCWQVPICCISCL